MTSGLAGALLAPPDAGDTPVTSPTPDAPATTSTAAPAPPAATPTATPDSAPPQMNQPQAPAPASDLPRFQRTFKSTLQGILMGLEMGGIPGAVVGGINPQAPQQQARYNSAMAQAKLTEQQGKATFASAQAAHEVAMAHQADVEYQAMPDKLQQESEGRSLENLAKAKQAGYLPIASVQMDQGTKRNTDNANAAMASVQATYGTIPAGLLYIHTGNQITVLKLQDPNASLPTINQARMAMGQKPIDPNTFSTLAPADRDSMARNALNFTDPRDANGEISQISLNDANMRLSTVQAQPDFNGKDALVASLQATVNHQQAVLDSGAGAAAIRAGKAKGAEAVAAQPGTTAAQVANIKATAGPEAAAAGAKAKAEAIGTAAGQAASAGAPQTDILGGAYTPPAGGIKESNKRTDAFKKDADDLAKTEGTFGMFNQVLGDINSGRDITGAQSVVALFNAIGLSATPLKGMGMRINSNTVQEHIDRLGLPEKVGRYFASLKNGEIITPQQIKDYATIAVQARHDAYVNKINEARGQGVDPSFLLPRGNGRRIDPNTGSIFYDAAGGKTPQEKAANMVKAASALGWQ